MATLQQRLGKAVRRLRKGIGFASQEDFADAVGLHRTTMSKIERGTMNLSLAVVERLAKGLRMRASELLAAAESEGRRPGRRGQPEQGLPSE